MRRVYRWIETRTVLHATVVVCTTPGAIQTYTRRFPDVPLSRFTLIENAFDEENFAESERRNRPVPAAGRPFTMVHSGVIYPSERDPVPLFEALAALKADGAISAEKFRQLLRATGHDGYLATLIDKVGIGDIVSLAPHVAYRDALEEMLSADGLLILQASNCNHQVPAKLYEYLRAGRPILALTDPIGDTAATLRAAGVDTIAPLDEKDAIIHAIARFLTLAQANQAPVATAEVVRANSRLARTRVLAGLLDQVALDANAKTASQRTAPR
jgi:glycosyltransferase involved in cell wall biosynthesis